MNAQLIIVEGLPCSGKSTTSAWIASLLGQNKKVCFVDEGTGDHPADYEFHALAPAGLLSEESQIVPLSQFSCKLLEKLLPYKIYDGLDWKIESLLMLKKWQAFADNAQKDKDTIYVFNCVLLQNPMCETMMRFGFSREESQNYIEQIVKIIQPMNPVVIYLKNNDIADSIEQTSKKRPGWLEAVIDYHISGKYGQSIQAKGLNGYLDCLEERQKRELEILSKLPLQKLVVENPQRSWSIAQQNIAAYLQTL